MVSPEPPRLLYRKSCGANAKKTCAEGFAIYHINRGEIEVAHDLLAYLENEIEALRSDDPAGQLTLTEALAARIRRYLHAKK